MSRKAASAPDRGQPKPFTLRLDRWVVVEPPGGQPCTHAVVLLPGRGCPADMMIGMGQMLHIPRTLLVAFQSANYAWYPLPISPAQQAGAVAGLPVAVEMVVGATRRALRTHDIPFENTAVMGFSAGAVVALKAMECEPFAACVSLSGAVLEPQKALPPANPKAKYLIQHNRYDGVFAWEERYLPMRQAYKRLGVDAQFLERKHGGTHTVYIEDVSKVAVFLRRTLGFAE